MIRYLRMFKIGDQYRFISLPVRNKGKADIDFSYFSYDFVDLDYKLPNNLIRAKSTIRDYLLCNDFKYFITITCDGLNADRYDFDSFYKFIREHMKYYIRKYKDLDLNYILIPEQHKDGAWHMHGVFSKGWKRFIYTNANGYKSICIFDNFGFSSVSVIRSKLKCSYYITKYITKDMADRGKGKHLYFCSKGLQKPVLIDECLYNNNFFDNIFFDYKNDFCYIANTNVYTPKHVKLMLVGDKEA